MHTEGENIIVEIFLLHTSGVLAKEKGIDNPSLKNYSKALFSKESSKDLTKKEASDLIEALQLIGVKLYKDA